MAVEENAAWLAVQTAHNVGSVSFAKLVSMFRKFAAVAANKHLNRLWGICKEDSFQEHGIRLSPTWAIGILGRFAMITLNS